MAKVVIDLSMAPPYFTSCLERWDYQGTYPKKMYTSFRERFLRARREYDGMMEASSIELKAIKDFCENELESRCDYHRDTTMWWIKDVIIKVYAIVSVAMIIEKVDEK